MWNGIVLGCSNHSFVHPDPFGTSHQLKELGKEYTVKSEKMHCHANNRLQQYESAESTGYSRSLC